MVGIDSVSLSLITKPWATGGNWVHVEAKLGRADPVLSSSAPEPGVIWGSGSAPWLCSPSELTSLHEDGNLMGSSLDLAELAAGQPARVDITQQALEAPPPRVQVGNAKRARVGEWGARWEKDLYATLTDIHSCMMDGDLQPALFGCQEFGEAWDVVERGQEF